MTFNPTDLFQTIIAFIATVSFSMLFNIPRRELGFCGLIGAMGWLVSRLTVAVYPGGLVMGTFLGTLTLTAISRYLSYTRRMPVLVYLIGGILPLVPGAGIYYTMYELVISNDPARALDAGLETAKITGVISIGVMCVLSLPRFLFEYRFNKTKPR